MRSELMVDASAFAANLVRVRDAVAPAAHMLVVKDDAYGHGLATTVVHAWNAGVRRFGAFDVRTGAAVRNVLGPEAEVFVWIVAGRDDAVRAVEAGLQIGVGDAALLEDVASAARRARGTATVHLKIDTGLHRNGVRPEAWEAFVRRAHSLEESGHLRVVGIWSHIAEASDAEDDLSRATFEDAGELARAAGLRPRVRHLAASAASFARPEFRYDLVRVGAFAYGIRPAGGPGIAELGIRPAATLRAAVTDVEGDRAEIAHGALDGLPSTLGGRVDVGTPDGPRRLIAVGDTGSVVAAWPGARVGDVVNVFGPGRLGEGSATDLAEAIDTIGEEIVLRVSPGVPRRWT